MSRFRASVSFLAAAVAGACFGGCHSDAADTADTTDAPSSGEELASLGGQLSVAQGSLSGALDEAKACFADFRECRDSGATDCVDLLKACLPTPELPGDAGVGGVKACFGDFRDCQAAGGSDCRDALKACLPTPPGLGGIGLGGIGAPGGGAPGGGLPGGGLSGIGGIFGFGGGNLPAPGSLPGAGAAGPGSIGALPGIDPAALAACKDGISASLQSGPDLAALKDAFDACVNDAFAGFFDSVCARISDHCDDAGAPAICADLVAACNDPSVSP